MADLLQSYFTNVKLTVGDKIQTFYRLLLNEELFFSQVYGHVNILFSAHGKLSLAAYLDILLFLAYQLLSLNI